MARPRRRWSRPATEAALVLVALLMMLAAGVAGFAIGRGTEDDGGAAAAETARETTTEQTTGATTTGETTTGGETTETGETETGGGEAGGGETGSEGGEGGDGRAIFVSAGCGACHTFSAANSNGNVGPNLNNIDLNKEEIEDQVRSGGGGMPPYEGRLSNDEIEAVADFIENG